MIALTPLPHVGPVLAFLRSMPMEGHLGTMPVPELLTWISQYQKSGTLEIRAGRWVERLAFEDGLLTFSSSSNRSKTLGRILIEQGLVTEAMHRRARKLREKKIGVAKALIELEILPEDQVMRFLRKKAESELFDLFGMNNGMFSFDEFELPDLDLLPLRVNVSNLLLRLTQRMDEDGTYDFGDVSGLHWERMLE